MRIRFVLPTPAHVPVGGFKVVYEYSNRLAEKGHAVEVVHVRDEPITWNPLRVLVGLRSDLIWTRRFHEYFGWFPYDPRVRLVVTRPAFLWRLGRVDCTIATAWSTAPLVAAMPARRRGKGFYFIQHFEDWSGPRDAIEATWKLPLQKIVIARWLAQIATDLGQTSIHIPNGLDFEEFGRDVAPADRDPHKVAMLWHDYEWKGSREGLAALASARQRIPTLTAEFFGTGPAPADLPDWVDYHQAPSRTALRALFNRCAIFLGPSHAEGWPLPPAEAMTCACAPVLTDIGGHVEYAADGRNALLVPARDVAAMAEALGRLLGDPARRIEIAETACRDIHEFTWARASAHLESVLSTQAPC